MQLSRRLTSKRPAPTGAPFLPGPGRGVDRAAITGHGVNKQSRPAPALPSVDEEQDPPPTRRRLGPQ
eukprot:15187012-Heterocapsa_arctica.AAC.1